MVPSCVQEVWEKGDPVGVLGENPAWWSADRSYIIFEMTGGHQVRISPHQWEKARHHRWHRHCQGYAVTNILHPKVPNKRTLLFLHVLLFGLGMDHVDGNRRDNLDEKVRPATVSQNGMNRRIRCDNRSNFPGVYFHKATGKYAAQIASGRVRRHLGVYSDVEAAKHAYAVAAVELFREFIPPHVREYLKGANPCQHPMNCPGQGLLFEEPTSSPSTPKPPSMPQMAESTI